MTLAGEGDFPKPGYVAGVSPFDVIPDKPRSAAAFSARSAGAASSIAPRMVPTSWSISLRLMISGGLITTE